MLQLLPSKSYLPCSCHIIRPSPRRIGFHRSVIPIRMPNRQSIQLLPVELPTRQELIHQRSEMRVVRRLEHVNHFVDDDVLKTLGWLPGKFGVEPKRACSWIADSPFCLHPAHEKPLHFHSNQLLPSLEQGRNGCSNLIPIPFLDERFPGTLIRSGPHSQKHSAVLKLNRGWSIGLAGLEEISLAPHVVALL